MPRRTQTTRESITPTLTPHRALELLRQQLAQADHVQKLRYDDAEVTKWELTTQNILHGAFGKPDGQPHENTKAFLHAVGGSLHVNMSDGELQAYFAEQTRNRKAVLESVIEQLEILAPPAAQVAEGTYEFHPAIAQVSGQLFRDGHYKQAALEAYIRVIDEAKARSGLALDGDSLVNRAFGCENQTPVIQFNGLQTDAERDEQKGIMFLFKGTVGLRNSKAHSNRLFNDPRRAHEYLALASLLMRLLEIATVNRP
ncbi:MAG TPA: TIGR02391 family protein [Candidatus Acidoferrales bacterium]|nr:TIGR02391 family protein [Candidatus Acidoferrales bacterium]